MIKKTRCMINKSTVLHIEKERLRLHVDRFNKITIQAEENDSNDSDDDIIQPTRKRRNLINSDSDTSSEKETIPVEDVSSEDWEDVSQSTDKF